MGYLFSSADCFATVVAHILHGKADATCHHNQRNEINRWRDKKLPSYLWLDEPERERDVPTRCRGATIFRGNGALGSLLCGGARFLDSQLLHTRPERVGMETKPGSGALLSFDDPTHILEDTENVGSLNLFQGIGGRHKRV